MRCRFYTANRISALSTCYFKIRLFHYTTKNSLSRLFSMFNNLVVQFSSSSQCCFSLKSYLANQIMLLTKLNINNYDRPRYMKHCWFILIILPRKEVIHRHLPVPMPCYDLTPIIRFTLGGRIRLRVPLTFMVWRAVCTRPGNVFTATCWSAITSDSDFKEASFSLLSELGPALMRFASHCCFASHCTGHCSAILAQGVREILTWHHPLLPPRYRGSLSRKIQLLTRVALVEGLNLTSHDTSWRRPCITCLRVPEGTVYFRRPSRDVKPW